MKHLLALGLLLGVALCEPGTVQAQQPDLTEAADESEELGRYLRADWKRNLQEALRSDSTRFLAPTMLGAESVQDLIRLRGLKGLRLSSVRDLDLTQVVKNNPGLEVLELSACGLTDLRPLSQLKSLRVLIVEFNQVTDVRPLAALTELTTLKLTRNRIRDLSALAGLKKLTVLDVSENPVQSIQLVAGLPALRVLSLFRCDSVADFSPLKKLTLLTHLNLSFVNTAKVSLADVAHLTLLENLRVQAIVESQQELEHLRNLRGLKHLTIGQNPMITSLEPLLGMVRLQYLDVHGCGLTSIRELAQLNQLRKVVLHFNQISDLNPLVGCPELQVLYAFNNPVMHYEKLVFLRKLKYLSLSRGLMTADQARAFQQKLPKVCRLQLL